MKFDRKALLAAVNESISAHVQGHMKLVDEWYEYKRQHLADWIEKYRDAWFDAASDIQMALKYGKPVTDKMLPKLGESWYAAAYYSEPQRFEDGRSKPRGNYQAPRELLALRDTLSVLVDDEITPHGLRNLGFTSAILRTAIQYLAKEEKE